MDYEKKLKLAKEALDSGSYDKDTIEYIFPELKKSEDERIRKAIHIYLDWLDGRKDYAPKGKYSIKDMIAWLEKQKVLTEEEDLQGKEYVLWCIKQAKKHTKDENEMGTCWLAEQWLEKQGKSYTKKDVDNAYIEGMAFAKDELEKQIIDVPKWKYKKDHTPLLRDSIILNKYGGVAKSPSGAIISGAWILDYDELIKLPKEEFEKQNEQKPFDYENANIQQKDFAPKVEPKFKIGDWVACKGLNTAKIINVADNRYEVEFVDGTKGFPHIDYIDRNFHLWTIQDAKDGDVLISGGVIFTFNKIHGVWVDCYCCLFNDGSFDIMKHNLLHIKYSKVYPAIKEQCDTLMKAITDAGYEWDDLYKTLLIKLKK